MTFVFASRSVFNGPSSDEQALSWVLRRWGSEELVARRIMVRGRRGQEGAAAVEFALLAAFSSSSLVMGIIQYGWYFYVAQTTGGAASHVARRLAVGDCWGTGEALTFVRNEVGSSNATTTLVMTPTTNPAADGITQVEVTGVRLSEANVVGFWPMPSDGTITRGKGHDRGHNLEWGMLMRFLGRRWRFAPTR